MTRILMVVALALLTAIPVFAQQADQAAPAVAPAPQAAPAAAPAAKDIAIYGEVKTVDAAASLLAVQYYDYDTDEEKSIDLAVGAGVKLENVANLGEIKKGDWVDATYAVIDGKNVAKTVSVEKEEEEPAADTAE